MSWFDDHPEDQVMVEFPPEVNAFLTGNRAETEPAVTSLFKEWSAEEEAASRQHARENYVRGEEINPLYHPVWRDEARKMNEELDDFPAFPPGATE